MPRFLSLLLAGACAALGCAKPPPPPVHPVTAEHFSSRVEKSSLTYLKWPAGHGVMVWADIDGFSTFGSGPCPAGVAYNWSVRELVTRRKPARPEPPPGAPRPPMPPGPQPVTTATEETGRVVGWRCETADGLTGRVVVNGEAFDLARGNLFLVSTARGGGVTQLSRDFSGLQPGHQAFADLAEKDEVIRKFVEAAVPTP